MVLLLADNGANLELRDENGYSPLLLACARGNDSLAYLMITLGADVNTSNVRKETSLHLAVLSNNFTLVEHLLFFHANHDVSDFEGFTPLHLAAYIGSLDIAQLLIQYGANPDKPSAKGDLPVFLSISSGYTEMTKYLLSIDTNFFYRNLSGLNVLDMALMSGNEENIRTILNVSDSVWSPLKNIRDSINTKKIWPHCLVEYNKQSMSMLRKYNIKRPLYPIFSTTAFRWGLNWGINDLFWIYGIDFNEVNYRTHASLGFGTRFWGNRYYFSGDNDTLYLLREYRSFLYFDLKKDFLLYTFPQNRSRLELIAGMKSNFVWAKYSGLKEKEKFHPDLIPEAGVKIEKRAVSWELTYQYWKYGGINNNPHLLSLYFTTVLSHFKK